MAKFELCFTPFSASIQTLGRSSTPWKSLPSIRCCTQHSSGFQSEQVEKDKTLAKTSSTKAIRLYHLISRPYSIHRTPCHTAIAILCKYGDFERLICVVKSHHFVQNGTYASLRFQAHPEIQGVYARTRKVRLSSETRVSAMRRRTTRCGDRTHNLIQKQRVQNSNSIERPSRSRSPRTTVRNVVAMHIHGPCCSSNTQVTPPG